MENLTVRACISEGWRLFVDNAWLSLMVVLVPLALLALSILINAIPVIGWAASFLSMFLVFPHIYAGLMGVMVGIARDQKLHYGELWAGFNNYWRVIGIGLVWYAMLLVVYLPTLIAAGYVLSRLIVVGYDDFETPQWFYHLYLINHMLAITMYLRYIFVWYLMIDEPHLTIRETYRRSAQLTSGNRISLFLVLAFSWLLVLVGLVALIVGLVVTLPIAILTISRAYLYLRGEAKPVTGYSAVS